MMSLLNVRPFIEPNDPFELTLEAMVDRCDRQDSIETHLFAMDGGINVRVSLIRLKALIKFESWRPAGTLGERLGLGHYPIYNPSFEIDHKSPKSSAKFITNYIRFWSGWFVKEHDRLVSYGLVCNVPHHSYSLELDDGSVLQVTRNGTENFNGLEITVTILKDSDLLYEFKYHDRIGIAGVLAIALKPENLDSYRGKWYNEYRLPPSGDLLMMLPVGVRELMITGDIR